jgi:uncharacterized protein (TIGR03067 family)
MMKVFFSGFLAVGILMTSFATVVAADDAKVEAIKKERKQIEGTWRVVTWDMDGEDLADVERITLVNKSDGSWSLQDNGTQICEGTSTIDPKNKPKTFDITITSSSLAADRTLLGIYELSEKTLKVCFAESGKERPSKFSSTSENRHTPITFERVKAK